VSDVSWRLPRNRSWARARGLIGAALVLSLGPAGSVLAAPGSIIAVAVSPRDGTLWVGAAEGLFRSGDRGRTLAAVALSIKVRVVEVTAVAVAPGSDPTVYVATGGEGI
jgi:hypothetical protein